MIERMKVLIKEHKTIAYIVLIVLAAILAYTLGRHASEEKTAVEKPAVLTQEQTQNAADLRAQLDISRANAQALQKRLIEAQAGQRSPSVTYYVTAPTVERAAQVVERQIKEDAPTLPRAAKGPRTFPASSFFTALAGIGFAAMRSARETSASFFFSKSPNIIFLPMNEKHPID